MKYLLLILSLVLFGCQSVSFPLRENEEVLRQSMLSRFPVGMSIGDFRTTAKRDKMRDSAEFDHLLSEPYRGREFPCTRIIVVELGIYPTGKGYTLVEVAFGFADGKLKDFMIRKYFSLVPEFDPWLKVG